MPEELAENPDDYAEASSGRRHHHLGSRGSPEEKALIIALLVTTPDVRICLPSLIVRMLQLGQNQPKTLHFQLLTSCLVKLLGSEGQCGTLEQDREHQFRRSDSPQLTNALLWRLQATSFPWDIAYYTRATDKVDAQISQD